MRVLVTGARGFVGRHLAASWDEVVLWGVEASQVEAINAAGAAWGRVDLGQGRRVQVEYGSANPTGPLHVGHGRGAVLGSAMASALAAADAGIGTSVSTAFDI